MTDPYGRVDEKDDEKPRCWRCGKLLAEKVTRPWNIKCTRCKASNSK